MATLDIRQRAGYLFLALTLAHVILISTQVTTSRGVPLLEDLVFGAFAEVQRVSAGLLGWMDGLYQDYVALQDVRADNARLRNELSQLRVRLQQEQAAASQTRTLQGLLDLRQSLPL